VAAFSALLRRAATHYDLTIDGEFSPPQLQADVSIIGGTGGAAPRLVRETIGVPVAMSVPIYVTGATQALFQAEIDAIDAYLRLGECTLEVSFTDCSAATIWTVYHAQPIQPAFSGHVDLKQWTQVTLQLVVSPFVTTAAVTLHNAAAYTAPDSVALSGMVGNYRAPLTVTLNATNADIHAAYLAIDASSYDAYRFDAKDFTWGAGETDTADADAFSGTAAYVASVTDVVGTFDTADLPAGPYLLLARVKVLDTHTAAVTTDYTSDTPATFTRATWHIVELGRCYLPTRVVRNAATALITVSAKTSSATAGDECCIDWVYCLPIGDGYFGWHPATATIECDTLGRDAATGHTYVDDVVNEQHCCPGATLMALGGTLLIVTDGTDGTDPTNDGAITVTYAPRFAWMR
jgi:hypothetical protein